MRTDKSTDITDTLTAEEAGRLLDMSGRHVRRLITSGALRGTQRPYQTTRAAVDAYRFGQRRAHVDTGGHEVRPPSEGPDVADKIVDTLRAELAVTRREMTEQVERLAIQVGQLGADLAQARAEVGRLEAELAQRTCKGQASDRRPSTVDRRGGAQRGGVWGRVGLWLKRRS